MFVLYNKLFESMIATFLILISLSSLSNLDTMSYNNDNNQSKSNVNCSQTFEEKCNYVIIPLTRECVSRNKCSYLRVRFILNLTESNKPTEIPLTSFVAEEFALSFISDTNTTLNITNLNCSHCRLSAINKSDTFLPTVFKVWVSNMYVDKVTSLSKEGLDYVNEDEEFLSLSNTFFEHVEYLYLEFHTSDTTEGYLEVFSRDSQEQCRDGHCLLDCIIRNAVLEYDDEESKEEWKYVMTREFGERWRANVKQVHVVGDESRSANAMYVLQQLHMSPVQICRLKNTRVKKTNVSLELFSSMIEFTIESSEMEHSYFDTFQRMEHLVNFTIKDSDITSVPQGLSNLSTLTRLDLSGNSLMIFNSLENFTSEIATWPTLAELQEVNLSGINLKYIYRLRNLTLREGVVYNSTIENLNLSNNQIDSLDVPEIFDSLTELTILDLSYNNISCIPSQVFQRLMNLEQLIIRNNSIAVLGNIEFNPNVLSLNLDLSHNNIANIEPFVGTGKLDKLNLAFNSITEWSYNEMFFINLTNKWVKSVNLSYNSLRYVSEEMAESVGALSWVDIGGNEFDCSNCNMLNFQRWLWQSQRTILRVEIRSLNSMAYEDLTCSTPKPLQGTRVIDVKFDNASCDGKGEMENATSDDAYVVTIVAPSIVSGFLLTAVVLGVLAYKYRFEISYIIHYWKLKKRTNARRTSNSGLYEFDAFVSYSRQDRNWVTEELVIKLEKGEERYKLCLHERDFHLGSLILENIEDAMRNSRYTIMILSRGFVLSQWCRWELEMANYKLFEDRREFLILIEKERLDRRDIPRHLKYLIDTRTYLEWPEPHQTSSSSQEKVLWRRLKKALGESLYQKEKKWELISSKNQSPKESDFAVVPSTLSAHGLDDEAVWTTKVGVEYNDSKTQSIVSSAIAAPTHKYISSLPLYSKCSEINNKNTHLYIHKCDSQSPCVDNRVATLRNKLRSESLPDVLPNYRSPVVTQYESEV